MRRAKFCIEGRRDEEFWFVINEFKKDVVHPGFDVGDAIGDGGEDGFGGHVTTAKMKSMLADDLTEGKHVDGEEEGAEDGTLGNTIGNGGGVGVAVISRDKLAKVRELGGEPKECCS